MEILHFSTHDLAEFLHFSTHDYAAKLHFSTHKKDGIADLSELALLHNPLKMQFVLTDIQA